MENNLFYPSHPPQSNQDLININGMRTQPPSHFLFRVQSYSLLSEAGVNRLESGIFEVGGYNWKLVFYPNGRRKGNTHISLFLKMGKVENVPFGWELNFSFKLFVYDHIRDKYLVIRDTREDLERFHALKTECGFEEFLSLDTFKDASNGYLVNDSCVFGCEVLVVVSPIRYESFSIIKDPAHSFLHWKVKGFSNLKLKFYCSPTVKVVGHKWKLMMFPQGYWNPKGEYVSLFLSLDDTKALQADQNIFVKVKLRLRNQNKSEYYEKIAGLWLSASAPSSGYPQFISHKTLREASNGYLLKDTLIFECQFLFISQVV